MQRNLTNDRNDINALANSAECGLIKIAYNSDMSLLYANDFFYTLYGYTREEYTELFGNKTLARIHPDDLQRLKAAIARQQSMGIALRFEYRVIKKDGSIGWILLNGKMRMEENQIVYLCSCLDVTSMKISYQDLAKSKLELDIISNNIPGGVAKISTSDYKLLYANDGFYLLGGYSRIEFEEEYNNICLELILEQDLETINKQVQEAIRTHSVLSVEFRIRHKTGDIHWCHLNGSFIEENKGIPIFLCVIVDITETKLYERKLELAQRRNNLLAELNNEIIWEYDVAGDTLRRSGSLTHSFSTNASIEHWSDFLKENNAIHPDDLTTYNGVFHPKYKGDAEKKFRVELRIKNNIGMYIWNRMQGIVTFDEQHKPVQIIGKTFDIDASKQEILKLQEESVHDELTSLFNPKAIKTRADELLSSRSENTTSAVILIDLDHFKIIADHYGRMLTDTVISETSLLINRYFSDELIGRIENDLFVVFVSDVTSSEDLKEKALKLRESIANISIESQPDISITASIGYFMTKDKQFTYDLMLLRANIALRAIKSKGGNGVDAYGTMSLRKNATSIIRSSEGVRNYHDGLTGLYTLPAFLIEAGKLIEQSGSKTNFAVFSADINRFHLFNANYGFTVGNKVLTYFARILQEEGNTSDVFAHGENDIFFCLITYQNEQEIADYFNRIKNRLNAHDTNIEDYYRFSITCGIATASQEHADIAALIDKADYARLSSKALTETSHYVQYTKQLEEKEKAELEMEASIDSAIANGEFVPYLQPKYSLADEKLIAVEALTRWVKSDGTILMPSEFIPMLEKNGSITELDFYIIEETLKIIKKWMEQKLPVLPVAFNISGEHLKTSNFVERLVSLMKQYAVPLKYLELEITETVYMKNTEQITYLMEELTDIGFKITLEDFGKASSAANALRDLNLHAVKLDTNFLHIRIQDKKERIIFKKIIEMAKELGIYVLAEGVETSLQADLLREFGCDVVQGFLYHNPMPLAEFEEYVLSTISE